MTKAPPDDELIAQCRDASLNDRVVESWVLSEIGRRLADPDIDHARALRLALAVNVRTMDNRHYFSDAITAHSALAMLESTRPVGSGVVKATNG